MHGEKDLNWVTQKKHPAEAERTESQNTEISPSH